MDESSALEKPASIRGWSRGSPGTKPRRGGRQKETIESQGGGRQKGAEPRGGDREPQSGGAERRKRASAGSGSCDRESHEPDRECRKGGLPTPDLQCRKARRAKRQGVRVHPPAGGTRRCQKRHFKRSRRRLSFTQPGRGTLAQRSGSNRRGSVRVGGEFHRPLGPYIAPPHRRNRKSDRPLRPVR